MAEFLPISFEKEILGEVVRLGVLPAPLTTVREDLFLKQKRMGDHIVDAVPSYPSVIYQAVAEYGNVVGDVPLRFVEHLCALIRTHVLRLWRK